MEINEKYGASILCVAECKSKPNVHVRDRADSKEKKFGGEKKNINGNHGN